MASMTRQYDLRGSTPHPRLPCRGLLTVLILVLATRTIAAEPQPAIDFRAEVFPLLKARCISCHGPAKQEGKLSLASPQGIRRGGKHGRAFVSGHPEKSLLWQRVAAGEMPVEEPLPPEERAVLRRWIEAGAPGLPDEVTAEPQGEEHWAFLPFSDVAVPQLPDDSQLRTPVDRFIAARLKTAGLTIGAEAGRETLIRRVCFDLTGLPPTLEEIDQFLSDLRPDAYERMVDRYLSSPHYGERWGKYWLDAAGYADSNGYFGADTDRPLAYRYRDYVIRSINADKPWDQFIREQLAGDEMVGYRRGGDVQPEMVELLEAVHYLRNSPDGTDSSDGNPDELRADRYAVLEGTQQVIGSSLLGLTVQCARCHDHKFEPFTQRDYYRLQAVIFPAFNVEQWINPKDRDISTATAAELAAWKADVQAIETQISKRREEFAEWARLHRQRGRELFADPFDPQVPMARAWSNTAPGDEAPAGTPAVHVDQKAAPAAEATGGTLHIIESGAAGDRALSTRQSFDWTPEEAGGWIQATFDLATGGDAAPYVGYFIALRDFNDGRKRVGGNILLDGAAQGQATVYVDYPGADSQVRGKIGHSGYVPGRNYGVRVTNRGDGKFEVQQVVDGVPEDGSVTLTAADLPDGGFGFEYCCGRSFVVDNLVIEAGVPDARLEGSARQLAEEHRKQQTALEAAINELEARKPPPVGRLAAVSDAGPVPPKVRLLARGEYKSPGDEVQAGAPSRLSEPRNPSDLSVSNDPGRSSTGQRLAFARWITEPDSRAAALLARVTVNRWWQHHFGTGLVDTPDNLGYSGSFPSHPELLEYLAAELIRNSWRAKPIHRMILLSVAYRQSSLASADTERLDPDRRLLSAFPLRRLDGEALRDGMLAVSSELDPRLFGTYVPTQRSSEGEVVVPDDVSGALRRSVYLQQRRTQVLGLLDAFDAPSIVVNCTARPQTTVPLQSLTLLNSRFVRARAKGFARHVRPDAGVVKHAALQRSFRIAWGRSPTNEELTSAETFFADQPVDSAWVDFCQMLLAANAFLYVE